MPKAVAARPAGDDQEATRIRVWRAAVELFAAKGFHGTGIRELADAAGLSSATLYHYMGSKDALLFAIMRSSLERLSEAAERVAVRAASPAEWIAGLVHVHVLSHALHPSETMVVDHELRALGDEHRAAAVELRDRYEGHWREAIDAGRAAGVFTAGQPTVVRLALLEMCSAVAGWYSPDGRLGLDEIAAEHARIALSALGCDPGVQAADFVTDLAQARELVAEIWQLRLPAGRH
ncbi:TetR/AcrR family transcriptional regulator [Streptomyces sp. A3M-1-3]|uniref:TetR/AcrR family transcriptional regulator n=1 Tax=Streptomyces sp. A3M-1-3 TaxID=2962044 RepID=UPI0020B803EC|nr:TetR/AcrR family transcriptional regulator [Streptomyces sp. A3M-1-3]MCP3818172.1 TetR/AcrR family transcriptional regulator [Streptomyces sp. A3M-1-3]